MNAFAGAELLAMLHRRQAFAPVAQPGYRSHLYVPFEDLVGGHSGPNHPPGSACAPG